MTLSQWNESYRIDTNYRMLHGIYFIYVFNDTSSSSGYVAVIPKLSLMQLLEYETKFRTQGRRSRLIIE